MPHQHLSLQSLDGLQSNAHDDDDRGTADGQVLNALHQVAGNNGQQGNDSQINGTEDDDLIDDLLDEFTGVGEGNWWYDNLWSAQSWAYAIVYFLMIFFFSWFYSTIQYDPVEISNNLKKNGGFIPGFRPGKPTADFIQKVINKIIVFGAVYLGIVALLPIIAGNVMTNVRNLAIGGTSVIIVVGVALETVKALEAQMLMRHYKGFLD